LGNGGNALDFHIACELGRILETARDTTCIVLSRDKGFDPLLLHLNGNGLTCHRIDDMDSLVAKFGAAESGYRFGDVVCPHCRKSSTIEHHGGRWCTNCGRFASPPEPGYEAANARSSSIFARSGSAPHLCLVPSSQRYVRRDLRRRRVDVRRMRFAVRGVGMPTASQVDFDC
jgi:hypothetical protein